MGGSDDRSVSSDRSRGHQRHPCGRAAAGLFGSQDPRRRRRGKGARRRVLQGARERQPRHVRDDGPRTLSAGDAGQAVRRRSEADGRADQSRLRPDDARVDGGRARWRGDVEGPRCNRTRGVDRADAGARAATAHRAHRDRHRRRRPARGCAASARRARQHERAGADRGARRVSQPARRRRPLLWRRRGGKGWRADLPEGVGRGRSRAPHAQRTRHAIQHRVDQQDLHQDRHRAARRAGEAGPHRYARHAAARLPQRRGEARDRRPASQPPGRHRRLLRAGLRSGAEERVHVERRLLSAGRFPAAAVRAWRQAPGTATAATSSWARSWRGCLA